MKVLMNIETKDAVDAAMAAVGSKVTYGGAGASVAGWLLSSEFAVLSGLILGLAGFLLNWYYRHKADKRAQAEHAAKMGFYE